MRRIFPVIAAIVLILFASPALAQQPSVAELVVNRFLTTGTASERDLLLLMSQPKEFLRYQQVLKATAPGLEQKALAIRRVVFQRALAKLGAGEGGGIVQAVIALGSWATELNAGDMDIIVKGGREAAKRFNQLLHEEIEAILRQEGDDVCRAVFSKGARFTLETFEIYVSTLEDFGYDSLRKAFREALEIAAKDGQAAGAAHLNKAADSIIRKNLSAQRFAAVQKEYYPGASGQDFVRDYFAKQGKSRTWRVGDNGALDSTWEAGLTADQLGEAMIKDLGLSVESMSGAFKFPVIADEMVQWVERSKLGAREQAKGLVRAYESRPGGYFGLLTEEEKRVLETARILANTPRENQAYIRQALKSHGFASEQAFSKAGEEMLWNLTKASNNEAMRVIVENQKAAVEAARAGKQVEAQYRRIKDYLMSNEQLAGYSKLKPEQLLKLADELPADMAFREELAALLEFMAEGSEKGARSATAMAKRLVKIAFQQKRLSAEATEEAIKAVRAGKGLSADVEDVIAVLRRDLADLASIRAVSPPTDTLADCIRTSSLFSKSGLTLTPELASMIEEISKLSNIELLQLGFKNSEIALLRELNAARAQGARLSAIGEALKKAAPKNYRAILKGYILEAKKAAPSALAFQGTFALWGVYNVVTDSSIPEEEQRKRLGEAIYTAFPTAGLVLDGLPMAYIQYTEGGEVDARGLAEGVAFAGLEILGLVHPVAAVSLLAAYATYSVSVGMIQAENDRQFIRALYSALDGDTLNVQGGKRSFNTSGVQIAVDPVTKLPVVIHSAAFNDLYTPRGDVLLETGKWHKPPYDRKVNEAIRDFAKRYVWATNEDLKIWVQAVKKNFPDIDLDQVESWNLGELTEQAATVTGTQFKVGARLVRRYLNQRDLLTESTLRHIRGRLFEMQTALKTVEASKKELAELELQLTMEERIIPNAQAEHDSFAGWLWDAATSNVTRLEQIAGIWKRYLKTYKEAVVVHGRVTKIFESADLSPPTGADLFGLTGVESKDKPKIDAVFQSFQTAFDKAYQEYRGAKGGNPDVKDPFDADAWRRLLSLRMRVFLGEFQKTTQARIAALEKDIRDVLEEVKEHYRGAVALTVTGPTEVEAMKNVALKVAATKEGKPADDVLKDARIEWSVNQEVRNSGPAWWFSPMEETVMSITVTATKEVSGKKVVLGSATHRLTVKKPKDDKKDGKDDKGDGKKDDAKLAATCSFEYTDWGECVRATKKQTRTVKAKTPAGCVERQKPALEQGCTPPPTEEDKRNQYFHCLCRCSSGWAGHIGVWYDPEGKSVPECKSNGPCFGGAGAFGCTRRHFFGGPSDCAKGCWEGAFGKGTYDADKADKLRKDENKKYKKPLTVTIKASKNPADFGDIVELTAETAEGSGGYKWSWGGCAQDAKNDRAKVLNSMQCKPCTASVTVTDQDGDSASASLEVKCTALRVKLTQETPKEGTIPIGGKATFLAEVFSGDKPASGSFSYIWEHNPDALFGDPKNPTYETKGGSQSRNTATFKKMQTTPVWVSVLKEVEGRKMTVGESERIPIQAVSPKLKLSVNKKEPLIGEKVVITVHEEPAMSNDIITFWWEIKGDAANPGPEPNIPNQRSYSFKPKNVKPVTVTVHAKAKEDGSDLGQADVTVAPKGYTVTIGEPRYLGPKPKIWKCDTQLGGACPGLVDVGDQQFAVHHDVFMKAAVNPALSGARYRWAIDPAGTCGTPGAGDEIKMNCSDTGTFTASLKVANSDGDQVGEASRSVTISVSQKDMDGSKKAKEAQEKIQKAKGLVAEGKLDEGIALANEAAGLDPKNAEAKSLSQKWGNEKQTVTQQLDKAKKLITENRFDQAEKEFAPAQKLHPKYPPVVETDKLLKTKKDEYKKNVAGKLAGAKDKARKGDYDGAIKDAEDAAKFDPANKDAAATARKLRQEKETIHQQIGKAKKLMDENKFADAQKELIVASNLNSYYPPVPAANQELGTRWNKYNSEVRDKVYEVRSANEKKDFGKALEIAAAWRASTKLDPYAEKELKQQEDWAKQWKARKDSQIGILKAAGEKVRNYDYAGALKQYDEGFANGQNLYNGTEPEYKEAVELRSQAFTKNKRLQELIPWVRKAAEDKEYMTVDALQNTLKTADEAIALQPNNEQLKKWREQIVARAEKTKADNDRTAAGRKYLDAARSEENTYLTQLSGTQGRQGQWGEKLEEDMQLHITKAIGHYRESLKYIPDAAVEKKIKDLEATLEGRKKYLEQYRLSRSLMTEADALYKEATQDPDIRSASPKYDEAAAKYRKSLSLYRPFNAENVEKTIYVLEYYKHERWVKKYWADGQALEKENRIVEAIAIYDKAIASFHPTVPQNDRMYIIVHQQDLKNRVTGAKNWRADGEAKQKAGKIPEAISSYRQSLKLLPDAALEAHVRMLEGRQAEAGEKKASADKLWQEGTALFNQGRPSDALTKFKESLGYWSDATRTKYVADMEARRAKAVSLREQGAKLQGQKRIPEAVAKYKESLSYWADTGLSSHIATLEGQLKQDADTAARKAKAKQLRDEGYALQQKNQLQAAVGKYKESLAILPDKQLEDYIRQLEAKIAAVPPVVKPTPPVTTPATASFDGTYSGTVSGASTGTVQFTVSGTSVTGTVSGKYGQDAYRATLSGTLNRSTGEISTKLAGDVTGTPFQGGLKGRIQGSSASGDWHARNQYGNPTGSWQASRGATSAAQTTAAQVATATAAINIVGRWKTETIEGGKVEDVSYTVFNRDGSYTMDVSPGELAGVAVCTIRGSYTLSGQTLNLRPQGSQCKFKDGTTRSEPVDKYDTVSGRVSGNDRSFTYLPGGNVSVRYTRQ